MAARSNAISEITRFWLQARHGCLVSEAIPVRVPYFFGTADFDRLFVVHAFNPKARDQICPSLAKDKRIHWLWIREVVADLYQWYQQLADRAALRHTFTGDLWHLLIGYCDLRLPS